MLWEILKTNLHFYSYLFTHTNIQGFKLHVIMQVLFDSWIFESFCELLSPLLCQVLPRKEMCPKEIMKK